MGALGTPYTWGLFRGPEGNQYSYSVRGYVPGAPLADCVVPMPQLAAARLVTELALALNALHERGVIHGDIKPENIIVRRAAAGSLDSLSQFTLIDITPRYPSGDTQGSLTEISLAYVAPEVIEGHPESAASDLYSLGAVLWWAIKAEPPCSGSSMSALLRAKKDFGTVVQSQDGLPLLKIARKMLCPAPDARPRTGSAVATLISDLIGSPSGPVCEISALRALPVIGQADTIERAAQLLFKGDGTPPLLRVSGPEGVGVSSLLRDLQDHVEAHGATTIAISPQRVAGRALADQLADALHGLLRGPIERSKRLQRRAPGKVGGSAVLDDALVAARRRWIVLFLDDAHLVSVSEASLLRRLVVQARSVLRAARPPQAGWQTVVGQVAGGLAEVPSRPLELKADASLSLRAWTLQEVAEFVRTALPSMRVGPADLARILEVSDGIPKRVAEILAHGIRVAQETQAEVDWARACRMPDSQKAASQSALPSAAAMSIDPHERQVLALLALWGGTMPLRVWEALWSRSSFLRTAEPEIEKHVDVDPDSGTATLRDFSLGRRIRETLSARELDEGARQLCAVARRARRPIEHRNLTDSLWVLVRAGGFRGGERRYVLWALGHLLRQGHFSDVEYLAGQLNAQGDCGLPDELLTLLEAAARFGSGKPVSDIDAARLRTNVARRYANWLRLRACLKARKYDEALKLIPRDQMSAIEAGYGHDVLAVVSWPVAADLVVALAESGREQLARPMLRRMRSMRWTWKRTRPERPDEASGRCVRTGLEFLVASYVHAIARLCGGSRKRASEMTLWGIEAQLARGLCNLHRETAALNNHAIAAWMNNQHGEATQLAERSVSLRRAQDDERGLAAALANLAIMYREQGGYGRAIASLSRSHTVASRNELWAHAARALVDLSMAHLRRGHYSAARRVAREAEHAARQRGMHGETARACGVHLEAMVGQWHLGAALSHWRAMEMAECADSEVWRQVRCLAHLEILQRVPEALGAQNLLAECLDLGEASVLAAALTVACSMQTGLDVKRALIKEWRAVRRAASRRTRLQVAVARALETSPSLVASRALGIVRLAIRYGCQRVALRCVELGAAHDGDKRLDDLLAALHARELEEGEDDLRVAALCSVSLACRAAGREADFWRLLSAAARTYGRLERKTRAAPSSRTVCQELATRILTSASGRAIQAGSQRLTWHDLAPTLWRLQWRLWRGASGEGGGRRDRIAQASAQLRRERTAQAPSLEPWLRFIGVAAGAQRAFYISGSEDGARVVSSVHFTDDHESRERERGDLSWTCVTSVLESGTAVVWEDAFTTPSLASNRSIERLHLRSVACAPVMVSGRAVGALYVDHLSAAGVFGELDRVLLELVAEVVGAGLAEARAIEGAMDTKHQLAMAVDEFVRVERTRVSVAARRRAGPRPEERVGRNWG